MRRNVRRRIAQERVPTALSGLAFPMETRTISAVLEPEAIFLKAISDPPTLGRGPSGPEIKAFDSAKPKQ
jgi:hypothetical protein